MRGRAETAGENVGDIFRRFRRPRETRKYLTTAQHHGDDGRLDNISRTGRGGGGGVCRARFNLLPACEKGRDRGGVGGRKTGKTERARRSERHRRGRHERDGGACERETTACASERARETVGASATETPRTGVRARKKGKECAGSERRAGRAVGGGRAGAGGVRGGGGGCRLQQRRRLVDKAEKFVGADSAGPPEHRESTGGVPRSCACVLASVYVCARVRIRVCARSYTCVRVFVYVCARVCIRVCACLYTCVCACVRARPCFFVRRIRPAAAAAVE